jgi:hypothetical protein
MSNLMNNNNMSNNINEEEINNLMPQFGKVMNVLQKLDGNGEADMDKLKEEMDALLENDFGINMKDKID